MRVLIFGDSITFGAWDSRGGWADRLKQAYNKEYQEAVDTDNPSPHQVINLGIGGDTSQGVLARFDTEYRARHSANWPPVFVISIGTNDGRQVLPAGSIQVPAEEYGDNLRLIIQAARKYSDKILLVGLFPLAEEELRFKNYFYSQSTLKQYDTIIGQVAKELSVPKVEIFHEVIGRPDYKTLLFDDGLHPNDAGHKLIYDLVKPQLESLIRAQ